MKQSCLFAERILSQYIQTQNSKIPICADLEINKSLDSHLNQTLVPYNDKYHTQLLTFFGYYTIFKYEY